MDITNQPPGALAPALDQTTFQAVDRCLVIQTTNAGLMDFLWLHRQALIRHHEVGRISMQWLGEDGKAVLAEVSALASP